MTDKYEVLERFAILTVDGKMKDEQAYREIERLYGVQAVACLMQRLCK